MNRPALNSMKENACGCAESSSVTDDNQCMCPATGLVQIIGRKYAVRLLTLIEDNVSIRFGDLRSAMHDMSSSTLSVRLTELERAGLIHRTTYSEIPPRVEYTLTAEGKRLRGSLFSLSRFASRQQTKNSSSAA